MAKRATEGSAPGRPGAPDMQLHQKSSDLRRSSNINFLYVSAYQTFSIRVIFAHVTALWGVVCPFWAKKAHFQQSFSSGWPGCRGNLVPKILSRVEVEQTKRTVQKNRKKSHPFRRSATRPGGLLVVISTIWCLFGQITCNFTKKSPIRAVLRKSIFFMSLHTENIRSVSFWHL